MASMLQLTHEHYLPILCRMASIVRKYDVGIVGTGPVGLVLSSLLSHYGVNHVLIERRLNPVVHPQAHFLNARTMEILQLYCPKAHSQLLKVLQKSSAWRYGVFYMYSLRIV